MDHLPLPDDVTEHLAVPYLQGIAYDNQGFVGYDTRQGWDIERLLRGDIRNARQEWNDYSKEVFRHCNDVESLSDAMLPQMLVGSFVQNWLLCGIFQAVLSRTIEEEEYVAALSGSTSNETQYLTTSKLFAEFVSRKNDLCQKSNYLTSIRKCLDKAGYVLGGLDILSEELGGFLILGPTHLMLTSIVQTLDHYLCFWHKMPLMGAATSHVRWLEKQLFDKGWCLNRVTKTRIELGIGGLYYASLLTEVEDNANHTTCTQEVCKAYNIKDDDLYIQVHRGSLCRCDIPACKHKSELCPCFAASKGINISDKANEIAFQGKIPLIQVERDGATIRYTVRAFDTGVEYIAVSHVWSDGMGNPSGNSIPTCQAEYLSRCAENILGKSNLFWIDTLCVPRWPIKAREKALEKMDEAYRNARVVLVFSSELTNIPLPSTSDEILIRIAQSKWLTRLWTMQEGVLAKELAFQFVDKTIDFAYLQDVGQKDFLTTSENSHFPAIQASLMVSHMRSFHADIERGGNALRSLWFSIRHRATSKPKDEAICGAILLQVTLDAIFAASVDKSMLALWRSLKNIPSSILWANGPRYMIEGARWAPKSLLDPRTWAVPIEDTPNLATTCSQGLCFQEIEGFYFPQLKRPLTEYSLIEFSTADTEDKLHLILTQNVGNQSWEELESVWDNIALLWNYPSDHQFVQGVLVSVTSDVQTLMKLVSASAGISTDDITVHARWLAQVTVMREGSDWDQMMSNMPIKFLEDDSPTQQSLEILTYPMKAATIPKRCRWCLG